MIAQADRRGTIVKIDDGYVVVKDEAGEWYNLRPHLQVSTGVVREVGAPVKLRWVSGPSWGWWAAIHPDEG